MKIVFILGFYPNQRMNKRMRLLMKENDVTLIYWKKNNVSNAYGTDIATENNYCIDIKFNESSFIERFIALQRFKKQATKILTEIEPDAVYVQNLDIFLFAERYKRKKKNKIRLIYEVSDINDILIQPQRNLIKKILQICLKEKEKRACKRVDLFCYTSPAFWEERYKKIIDSQKKIYLPNIPNLEYFEGYVPNPWEDFTIGYVGTVRYEEQLRLMLNAAKEANIKVIIAGGVASGGSRGNKVDIEQILSNYPDVVYLGPFNYPSQIASIYSKINVSFAVYDSKFKNVRIALPNKLYEAIKCNIPIIVAPDTYLSNVVTKLDIGLVSNDVQQIGNYLKMLSRDKKEYSKYENLCEKHADIIDAKSINESFCKWFNN